MINFQKKVLSNGLRVIVAPMKNTEAATLLVLAGVGSRHETKKINGISHFLEHLFFKGTKKRPTPGQINRELDKMGAMHNAFTSKEMTGFWVKSSAKDFDAGLDIVSDILLSPIFKVEEIEKERGVILQEIGMWEDDPRNKVWEALENVAYGDQPIGWDIIGNKETVMSIQRSDILKYKTENYLSKNMVVAAAGDLDVPKIFAKIEKYFQKVRGGENRPPLKVKISGKFPRIKIINKKSDQTHLAMAFQAYDMHDERRYALNLLSVILGGNMSSKLFMEIREKLGLAYYVFSFGDQATDCGYLGIGAGVAHTEFLRTVKKISEILKNIRQKGVSKRDLSDAKSYVRGQTALGLETSDNIANFCATKELFYKKIVQPEEVLKKIEKVTQGDIMKVAEDICRPGNLSLAAIGDLDPSVEKEIFNYA